MNPQAERGYLLLQAAVVEGALSDITAAYSRLDPLLELDDDTLLTLVRVCADFVTRMSLLQGHEWTYRTDGSGQHTNIEDRSPAQRVFTLRVLAAWSAEDRDTVEALLRAACTDPERRRTYIRDVFEMAVDWSEQLAERAGNPRTIVYQLTKSILKEGLGSPNWNA